VTRIVPPANSQSYSRGPDRQRSGHESVADLFRSRNCPARRCCLLSVGCSRSDEKGAGSGPTPCDSVNVTGPEKYIGSPDSVPDVALRMSTSVPAHPPRRTPPTPRCQPPAAGAGRLHPPGRPGRVHLAPTRLDRVPQRRAGRARGDGRRRLPGGALPGTAAPRALRGHQPLDRVRRQPVPPAGPPGADYLLAPTHEEMFTLLVKDLYSSYKDLPLSIYQIQTKFRDEARPRAGLLRGPRVRDEGLLQLRHRRRRPAAQSYDAHRAAYIRTFDRLGLPYVIVSAMSGAMGGSASEEFLAPSTWARTPSCAARPAATRPTSKRSITPPPG
jgi:hypothetical protein